MRVLLVEDEPLLAMLLEESLVDLGHEPVGAVATVSQAMALLDSETVDCALLDFSLGGNDNSVAVAQRLRQAGVPFCYLSGHSSLDTGSGAPDAPMMTKPVSIVHLEAALDQMESKTGANLRIPADCPAGQGSSA
ncbi:DNA-binding response OmpR family regulator [Novosphingobium hassiacum]|uniref:DNA-binding response OmpR family regulator n=1 Tax=Novosphingobium hassiacum TaxID=173676 RepID=A0A7W5ZX36_9SPHN|nr:response regulator [Novosphingobium hassiacum]MBB3859425.1 DNA-binding response OmpR family regulator [Novosphingobium hassiacum]